METLTIGTIGFVLYIGGKFIDWGIEKLFDQAYEDIMAKLEAQAPETATKVKALPGNNPAATAPLKMDAALVTEVEAVASANPEIKSAMETVGQNLANQQQTNTELAKAIQELSEQVNQQKAEKSSTGNVSMTATGTNSKQVGVINANTVSF